MGCREIISINISKIAIPGFNVIDHTEENGELIFKVESVRKYTPICPTCFPGKVYKHSTTYKTIYDVKLNEQKVTLLLKCTKFKCYCCKKIITEVEPKEINPKFRMTERLYVAIAKTLLLQDRTITSVANYYGVSKPLVVSVILEFGKYLFSQIILSTPRILGIDEIFHGKKYNISKKRKQGYAVFTDIEEGLFIELLPDMKTQTIEQYLQNLPNKEGIECVTMDMSRQYRPLVKKVLPWAKIVPDKAHITANLHDAVDTIRLAIKKSKVESTKTLMHAIQGVLKTHYMCLTKAGKEQLLQLKKRPRFYPLYQAYIAKEIFTRILNTSENIEKAKIRYRRWKTKIKRYPKVAKAFQDFITMADQWGDDFFTYTEYRYTNAFTESYNAIIRRIINNSKNISHQVLRILVIFGQFKLMIPPRTKTIQQAKTKLLGKKKQIA